MKTKVILVGLVTVSLVLSLFLIGSAVGAEKEVKIGIMQALTGDLGTYGGPMTDAAKLAVKEVNENGGVHGADITVIVEDTQTSENSAVDAATKLVKVNKVPAIIGTTSSGPSMAIIDITTGNGVIQISSSNTAPDFSTYEDNDLYFRTCPSDTLQGKAMARLAINEGYTTASTLVLNNPYGVGFEKVFKDEFESLGGTVLESVKYDPAGTIFDSEVMKACKPEPEVVMLCSYPETGSVVLKAAYEKGYMDDMEWLLSEGLRDETLAELVGKDEAGNYVVTGLNGTTPDPRVAGPAYESFKVKYEAEYDKEVTTYCSNSYDAAVLVALAIEKAEKATGTAIKAAIREVANPPGKEVTTVREALTLIREGQEINYQGASGEITFDENGDVSGAYCRWYIAENGSIVLAEPIYLDGPEVTPTPEAATPVPEETPTPEAATPVPEETPTPEAATPVPEETPEQPSFEDLNETPEQPSFEDLKEPSMPGFEAIFAITGILAVAYLRMWRKAK